MPNYEKIDIKSHSREEWLKMRLDYIGGSDASIVIGANPYASTYELFCEKIGEKKLDNHVNESMIIGTCSEDMIKRLYQYWVEGEPEQTQYNLEHDNKIRKVYKPSFMFVSKDHSFMSANVDGIITSAEGRTGNGIFEAKMMNGHVYRQNDGKIPVHYYMQLQHYLAVTGLSWGHFQVIVDGSKIHQYEFERDEELIKDIIKVEGDFWAKVQAGKKHFENGDIKKIEYPEVDNSVATEKYLNEKIEQEEEIVIKGDTEYFKIAQKYTRVNATIKEFTADKRLCSNQLKEYMGQNQGNVIDFGEGGKVTCKKTKRGSLTFRVNIK